MSTRLTGGVFRSRIIETPEGNETRPSASQLREALFNILGSVEGTTFVDFYAGSGSVGFEALSRGSKEVVFVENARKAIMTIQKNAQLLKVQPRLISSSVPQTLELMIQKQEKFDVVFVDPPFVKEYPLLPFEKIVAPGGVLIYQAPSKNRPEFLNSAHKIKIYGESLLAFYYAS